MNPVVIGFIVFCIAILALYIAKWLRIPWEVHLEMVYLSPHMPVKSINFNDFLREFHKYEWLASSRFNYSFFPKDERDPLENEIHASMIIINRVKYIFDYRSYRKFMRWNKKTWKEMVKKGQIHKNI